jgi:hypothetical protein
MGKKGKTRNQILKQILQDTLNDKITWIIDDINEEYVRVKYILQLTPNKKLTSRIVYFINNPKKTTLYVSMEVSGMRFGEKSTSIIPVMSFGSSMRGERKTIIYLLNNILLKEEKEEEN